MIDGGVLWRGGGGGEGGVFVKEGKGGVGWYNRMGLSVWVMVC